MRILKKLKKTFFLFGGFYTIGKVLALCGCLLGFYAIQVEEKALQGVSIFFNALFIFIMSCKEFDATPPRIFGCKVSRTMKWSIFGIMALILIILLILQYMSYWGRIYVAMSLAIIYMAVIFKAIEYGPQKVKSNDFFDLLWENRAYILFYITGCIGILILSITKKDISNYGIDESIVIAYGGAAIGLMIGATFIHLFPGLSTNLIERLKKRMSEYKN